MNSKHSVDQLYLYACLPFVELAHENHIHMGPISFWPASKFETFLPLADHQEFQHYLQSIRNIRARTEAENLGLITTMQLSPHGTTCLSIDPHIPIEQREFLLIDSLYLLYFACTFRDLYYNNEIPSFHVFRKMIPASMEFIRNKNNWEHLYIEESNREETICVHLIDTEICQGLGTMLSAIYDPTVTISQEAVHQYQRLICAIRYLVDRFFQRFINLLKGGLNLSQEIFEPEDVIFLASSFEALFDLNDRQPAIDFKHKLRPLLHIKYSRPLEVFWKWVDDFYEIKRKIVHGGNHPDPIFRLNPNFEISHILIGIKLLIYSVYYMLFKLQLLSSQSEDPYTPPDFKWIHPEELLLFFWTEKHILTKLDRFMAHIIREPIQNEELCADAHLLANLFLSMYNRYYQKTHHREGIRFIPSPLEDLTKHGTHILELLAIAKQDPNKYALLFQVLPPELESALHQRLSQ